MSGKSTTTTLLLSALIAAIAAVAAWLLYFSPTFDAIAADKLATENQQGNNELLEFQLAKLRTDADRLPEVLEELADIAEDLPPVEDGPGFVRTIAAVFAARDLVILKLEIQQPVVVNNTVTLADAAAVFDQGSYIEDLKFADLYATKFTISTMGSQLDVLMLVNELQTGKHRYFLIESLIMAPLEPAEAQGERPAIGEGWVEATISGVYFTLVDPAISPNFKPGPSGDILAPVDAATDEAAPGNDQAGSDETTPEQEGDASES